MAARRREGGRVPARLLALPIACLALGGCAAVGTAITSEYVTGVSVVSWLATGKTVSDHALSVATGSDCNVLSGIASSDRDICEAPGAVMPDAEFRGVLAMLAREPAGGAALATVEFAPAAAPPALIVPRFESAERSYNAYAATLGPRDTALLTGMPTSR